MNLNTISCFSGIGGFELACQTLGGFNVRQAIEINPFRQKVLRKNFPNLTIHDDITTYNATGEKWDLLITTFPCKGMSVAGKGEGYANKYSQLWWESFRLIQECKPNYVVIENVRGFINRGLRECLDGLRMAGYIAEDIEIISAKETGACHQRERVFVVAYANSIKWREQPTCWSRQVGRQIEIIREKNAKNTTDSLIERSQRSQPQSNSLSREEWMEAQAEGYEQKRSQFESGRQTLSCGKTSATRTQLQSNVQRVANGVSEWLDEYSCFGWWKQNPYLDDIAIPRRSDRDRQKRISALGDACTPQQAAIPLMRVKYLEQQRVVVES